MTELPLLDNYQNLSDSDSRPKLRPDHHGFLYLIQTPDSILGIIHHLNSLFKYIVKKMREEY
jgi:hypothetical protein